MWKKLKDQCPELGYRSNLYKRKIQTKHNKTFIISVCGLFAKKP